MNVPGRICLPERQDGIDDLVKCGNKTFKIDQNPELPSTILIISKRKEKLEIDHFLQDQDNISILSYRRK